MLNYWRYVFFLENHVKRQAEKFRKGLKNVHSNREQWSLFAIRCNEVFEKVIDEAIKNNLFDNLYTHGSKDFKQTSDNQNFLMFFGGSHPTGVVNKQCEPGEPSLASIEHVTEKGPSLLFSQDVKGGVVVRLCPSCSDVLKRKEDNIFVAHYSKPCDLTSAVIYKHIRTFFSYFHVSSAFGNPTWIDKYKIKWILFRDLRKRDEVKKLLVILFHDWLKVLIPVVITALVSSTVTAIVFVKLIK